MISNARQPAAPEALAASSPAKKQSIVYASARARMRALICSGAFFRASSASVSFAAAASHSSLTDTKSSLHNEYRGAKYLPAAHSSDPASFMALATSTRPSHLRSLFAAIVHASSSQPIRGPLSFSSAVKKETSASPCPAASASSKSATTWPSSCPRPSSVAGKPAARAAHGPTRDHLLRPLSSSSPPQVPKSSPSLQRRRGIVNCRLGGLRSTR